jgi:hypothetical protein
MSGRSSRNTNFSFTENGQQGSPMICRPTGCVRMFSVFSTQIFGSKPSKPVLDRGVGSVHVTDISS